MSIATVLVCFEGVIAAGWPEHRSAVIANTNFKNAGGYRGRKLKLNRVIFVNPGYHRPPF
jgi:hypothetical protein